MTEGGLELYHDVRRNSLEEAIKLCLENGLQGIVSDVEAIFRNPGAINKIKDSKLSLLTYGKLKYALTSFLVNSWVLGFLVSPCFFSLLGS